VTSIEHEDGDYWSLIARGACDVLWEDVLRLARVSARVGGVPCVAGPIVFWLLLPQPRRRRTLDLGVVRCAERPYAVHTLPWSQPRK